MGGLPSSGQDEHFSSYMYLRHTAFLASCKAATGTILTSLVWHGPGAKARSHALSITLPGMWHNTKIQTFARHNVSSDGSVISSYIIINYIAHANDIYTYLQPLS